MGRNAWVLPSAWFRLAIVGGRRLGSQSNRVIAEVVHDEIVGDPEGLCQASGRRAGCRGFIFVRVA
jgi:hypothetical protein